MKAFTAAAMAGFAGAFRLSSFEIVNDAQTYMDNKLTIAYTSEFFWDWGLRSPVQWAPYEAWHTAVTWSEQLYTDAEIEATLLINLTDSDFNTLFGLSLTPYFIIADISFFENIFFYWPPASWESYEEMVDDAQDAAEDEEESLGLFDDHCNYQGWWAEIFTFKVDVGIALRSCEMGVYDMLVDSGSFACGESWGYVDEVIEMEIEPFHRFQGGRYDMDWTINTCEDYKDKIDSRDLEVRSLKDMFKELQEEDGEMEAALHTVPDYW
jgi:hypothetical protein